MTHGNPPKRKPWLGRCRTLAVAMVCFLPVAGQAETAAYKYDSLGRLIEIAYDSGVIVKYDYDATGNRSTESVTGTGILSPEMNATLEGMFMLLLED